MSADKLLTIARVMASIATACFGIAGLLAITAAILFLGYH